METVLATIITINIFAAFSKKFSQIVNLLTRSIWLVDLTRKRTETSLDFTFLSVKIAKEPSILAFSFITNDFNSFGFSKLSSEPSNIVRSRAVISIPFIDTFNFPYYLFIEIITRITLYYIESPSFMVT